VASTKCTDRFLTGSEPEYDYEGDDWEDERVYSTLELVPRDRFPLLSSLDVVLDAMCECVPPCVVKRIIYVKLSIVL
jgi:hypothetical protein